MADVGITNCTILKNLGGDFTDIMVLTPSTADSADTVDVSTLVTDGDILDVSGWDVTSGDSVTATYATSTGVITIDAGGGTTNHMYALNLKCVSHSI